LHYCVGSVKSFQAAHSRGRQRAIASLLLELLSFWDVKSYSEYLDSRANNISRNNKPNCTKSK